MSKYIRKKDGSLSFLSTKHEWFLEDKDYIRCYGIIKFADTIEELCDAFIIATDGFHHTSSSLENAKKLKELFSRSKHFNGKEYTVYGAIWTDKGLIYVAKLNNKEELELL